MAIEDTTIAISVDEPGISPIGDSVIRPASNSSGPNDRRPIAFSTSSNEMRPLLRRAASVTRSSRSSMLLISADGLSVISRSRRGTLQTNGRGLTDLLANLVDVTSGVFGAITAGPEGILPLAFRQTR